MKNTFPPNCKKQTAQIVLLGIGLSGIDFLFSCQAKFEEINVVLFEKSEFGPFLLEALLMTRNKKLNSSLVKPSCFQVENLTFTFIRSSIGTINEKERVIYHKCGKLGYDFLLTEETQFLKVVSNTDQSFGTLVKNYYSPDCQVDDGLVVLIEGHDLIAIAIAISLLHLRIVPIIICKDIRLASTELPEEEAWLLGKYLKHLGIESIFDTHLNFNSLKENKDFLEIKTSKAKTLHAHTIISASGDSLQPEDLERNGAVANSCSNINSDHFVSDLPDIFSSSKSSALVNCAAAESGFKMNKRHYLLNASSLSSQCFFSGLEWKRYGEISPNCGQDTHNFYWEHPGGEVSFRMQYRKSDLLIKGLCGFGLPFKNGFIEAILEAKWNAHQLIGRMNEGLINQSQVTEVYPLIKKSFGVEFKDEIKKTRVPFFKRIIKKLFFKRMNQT